MHLCTIRPRYFCDLITVSGYDRSLTDRQTQRYGISDDGLAMKISNILERYALTATASWDDGYDTCLQLLRL